MCKKARSTAPGYGVHMRAGFGVGMRELVASTGRAGQDDTLSFFSRLPLLGENRRFFYVDKRTEEDS